MNARTPRRMVVALGGRAIVPRGPAGTADQQLATIERAMAGVATLVLHGRSGTVVAPSDATVGAGW